MTTDDPLVNAIKNIVGAMQSDYPQQFIRLYPDNDGDKYESEGQKNMNSLRMLKRRLYKLLLPFPIECIIDGYESCSQNHPEFIPSIPSIVAAIGESHAKYKIQQKKLDELEGQKYLPSQQKKTMTGPDILNMLGEALSAPRGPEKERAERLKNARENHDRLTNEHTNTGKIRTSVTHGHLCARCNRPGVISHSTSGGGNWYCSEHFHCS